MKAAIPADPTSEPLVKLDYTSLSVTIRDAVAEITLNRPEVLNRIDEPAHRDLTLAVNALASDDGVRVVILASTGKHFSAGGDLNEVYALQSDPTKRARFAEMGRTLLYSLLDLSKPMIAAVQGDAHGLGANIVLTCDAVVAQRRARLSDAHVLVGMVAGDGGCLVWPQAVGMLWAKRHLLTGEPITAEAGYARGLVTDLVDAPDDVLPAARALARRMASLPPLAVQGTKRALNRVLQQRAGEVFDYALALEQLTLGSRDVVEAVDAFKEKRAPIYEGR